MEHRYPPVVALIRNGEIADLVIAYPPIGPHRPAPDAVPCPAAAWPTTTAPAPPVPTPLQKRAAVLARAGKPPQEIGELLGGASLAEVHSLIRAAAELERGQPAAKGQPA